jgi:hypothetical protein
MVKQIIKEAIEKNPIALKEAVEVELQSRISAALEEAKNPNALDIKIPELDKAGINYEVFQSVFKRSKKDIHVKSSDDAIAGRKLIGGNPAYSNFRVIDTTPSRLTR